MDWDSKSLQISAAILQRFARLERLLTLEQVRSSVKDVQQVIRILPEDAPKKLRDGLMRADESGRKLVAAKMTAAWMPKVADEHATLRS